MRYAIRKFRNKWGLFEITDTTGEDGRLLGTYKTSRTAERALQRRVTKRTANLLAC